jgi:hypothetical protein
LKRLWFAHLCGESFRSLGEEHNFSPATAYRKYQSALDQLPECADLTRKWCTGYCGILLFDGKYLAVKGYERKIPVVYGIDYLTHDIPHYLLSVSENYQTCLKFFTTLRLLNYSLQAVVADDNVNIFQSCLSVYPKAATQLCHNHYKQSLRLGLNISQDPTYRPFMREIEELLAFKRSREDFTQAAGKIYHKYQADSVCAGVMVEMQKKLPLLQGYLHCPGTPTTTNLIESYNSHLEGRLKTIKGFESFAHADAWLNSYFIKRRLKKLTDCEGKFKKLNGTYPLENALKKDCEITDVLKLIR